MRVRRLDQKLILIILAVLIPAQAVYIYLTVQSFKASYRRAVMENVRTVGSGLQIKLNGLLQKGIPLSRMSGFKAVLNRSMAEAREIGFIEIRDDTGSRRAYCNRKTFLRRPNQGVQSAPQILEFPLYGNNRTTLGQLMIGIDDQVIGGHLTEIALDIGTIGMVSVLTILDFLFFGVALWISLPVRKVSEALAQLLSPGQVCPGLAQTRIEFLDSLIHCFETRKKTILKKWEALHEIARNLPELKIPNGKKASAIHSLTNPLSPENSIHDDLPDMAVPASLPFAVMIRPALFLFVFAEALSISFLPLFAKQLYRPLPFLPEEVAAGLPITAFMFWMTISLPLGGYLADRIGHRKTFLLGAGISAVGLLLCGRAGSLSALIGFRSIVGFGFGLVFMTAQMYILDQTTQENRAEGMGIFLSAFYSGTLCGSAIGGILSDHLTYRFLFGTGALLAICATLFLVFLFPPRHKKNPHFADTRKADLQPDRRSRFREFRRNLVTLFLDRGFFTLVWFESIPNKICLIGFVYYLVPLLLESEQVSRSNTGRVIMIYSLIMILLSQWFSRLSDQYATPRTCVFWGGLFSGAALLIPFFDTRMGNTAIGIALLGLAHAFSVSNQAKLASQLPIMKTVGLGPGMGIYRQVERLGNVLAPLITGALLSQFGYAWTLGVIGLATILAGILFRMFHSNYNDDSEVPI